MTLPQMLKDITHCVKMLLDGVQEEILKLQEAFQERKNDFIGNLSNLSIVDKSPPKTLCKIPY